jgi:hypothetical protein
MSWFFQPPQSWIAALLAAGLAAWSAWRGLNRLSAGLRNPDHPDQTLWVIKGIRGGIVAIAGLFFLGGILAKATWPLLFGVVFIGEELLETGIMLLALRSSRKRRDS